MKNWKVRRLGDLCEVITKGTTPTSIGYSFEENGINFIKVESLSESGEIIPNKVAFINEACHRALKRSQLKKDDILFSIAGALGRIGIVSENIIPANTNQALAIIRVKSDAGILIKFLSKYFNSGIIAREIEKLRGGAAQQNLSLGQLNELSIPFPPIPEQQKIVTLLDKCFQSIDRAKTIAEKNLQNANELFESYLNGVFEKGGEGWVIYKLIEITNKIGSGATPKGGNESYKTKGISLVRSMNVHDFEFREKNLAFIDENQAKELNNVTLQENDVLLNITGASVARCCLIPKDYLPARVNQHVSIIRAKKEIIDPKFLNLLLTSKFYKDQLLFTGEQGATRQAITKGQLEVFEVSFPYDLKVQKNITSKINDLALRTKKLETTYLQRIRDLEELKKSILQKAFNGELNTENIEI